MAQFDRSPGPRRSGRLPAVMAAILALGLAAGAAPGEAGRIAGRAVRDAGGDAAGGAEVVLLPPPPKGRDVYIGKLPLRRAVADAAGAFAFDGLAPGRYRIWANLGKLTSRRERAGGQVVNLPETGAAVEPVELRLVAGV
ncbi:MAG TPA: hypothetical protein VF590_16015, partial [Isosphaeraceae bacterium]